MILVAATNRIDAIDPALLRPGRFDHLIEISLPDTDARKAILQIHLPKEVLSNFDLDQVAASLEGTSGADIEAICREARLIAIRRFLDLHGETLTNQEAKERLETEGLPIIPEDMIFAVKQWKENPRNA